MSTIMMLRKCEHCGKKYPYNPGTGNWGCICPKCGRPQTNIVCNPNKKSTEKAGDGDDK